MRLIAFNPDVFNTLKYIHILAAILWVGTGFYFQVQATRLNRMNDSARMFAFTKDVEFAGQRLLGPASGVVLLAGIAMVAYSPDYNFTDAWILIGLLGAVATAFTGMAILTPTIGKIGTLGEERGPDDPEVKALTRRIFLVSRIDQVVLLIVIAVMVFKPGR